MSKKVLFSHNAWWKSLKEGGSGSGTSYNDSALKRRISALESGKQDNLVAGDGIILVNNTISASKILNDTRTSTATVWSSSKVKSLFESLKTTTNIVVCKAPNNPFYTDDGEESTLVNNTLYYIQRASGAYVYDIYFYTEGETYEFGSTEINLSNYYVKSEVNTLLDDKVDKVDGKSLVSNNDIEQITTNKTDIANLKSSIDDLADIDVSSLSDKQDKITNSTLSSVSDTTYVSDVDASNKTSKRFTLSTLWKYILSKISGAVGRGISVKDNVIGHSNDTITAKTNTNIVGLKYDAYGHITGKGTEYVADNTYTSQVSANNQLFTRNGAYALYDHIKRGAYNSRGIGRFYRTASTGLNRDSWLKIILTGSDVWQNNCSLQNSGIKFSIQGVYRITMTARLTDTSDAKQWCLTMGNNSGSFDTELGGVWHYTHTRHKGQSDVIISADTSTVYYPWVYCTSSATLAYCSIIVERIA